MSRALLISMCVSLPSLANGPQGENGADRFELERARATVTRAAVARIAPSIVSIETIGGAQPIVEGGPRGQVEASFRLADGPTTGVIWTGDGYIITSSINFARDPTIITVTLHDGRRLVARLLARDEIRRLALLKVDAVGLHAAAWASADEARIGQYAIACGRALGGASPSLSLGIVSALKRRNGAALQTDAKTSPVNYGGPLIDIEGRVLGLIVPMAGSGGALAGAEWYDSGIGFAVYRHRIDAVFERLAAGESIEPGKIGVVLEEDEPSLLPFLDKLLPPTRGVRIKEVARHSPASRKKLEAGDKILAIDGQPTGDLPELQRRLSDRAAGEEIRLSIKRRWRTFDVTLRLVTSAEIGRVTANGAETDSGRPVEHGGREGDSIPTTQPDDAPDTQPTSRPSAGDAADPHNRPTGN